jgi:hypothetical protein
MSDWNHRRIYITQSIQPHGPVCCPDSHTILRININTIIIDNTGHEIFHNNSRTIIADCNCSCHSQPVGTLPAALHVTAIEPTATLQTFTYSKECCSSQHLQLSVRARYHIQAHAEHHYTHEYNRRKFINCSCSCHD